MAPILIQGTTREAKHGTHFPAVDTIDGAPLVEPPTVEVREYTRSPTVAVVGWAPEETAYGLRTVLRRDGTSDLSHRLYVSTYFVPGSGDITQAVGLSQPLQLLGVSRNDQNCYRSGNCSPYQTSVPAFLMRCAEFTVVAGDKS